MRWRLLAVAVVLLTAGCGSALTGEGPGETLTPATVPDEGADNEQQQGAVVPGIDDGVVDPELLVDAHAEAAQKRSYVWRQRVAVNVDVDNGSALAYRRQFARVESETTYFLWSIRTRAVPVGGGFWNYQAPGQMVNHTVYADGDRRYVRYGTGPDRPVEVRAGTLRASNHSFIGRETGRSIRRYLAVSDSSVNETVVDGTRYYRVAGSRADLSGADPVRDYRVTARVAPDGFVRSLNVTYRTEIRGEPSRVSYSFEHTRINETTVDEPDWVPP